MYILSVGNNWDVIKTASEKRQIECFQFIAFFSVIEKIKKASIFSSIIYLSTWISFLDGAVPCRVVSGRVVIDKYLVHNGFNGCYCLSTVWSLSAPRNASNCWGGQPGHQGSNSAHLSAVNRAPCRSYSLQGT